MDINTVNITMGRAVATEKSQFLQDCELVADTKPAIDKVLKADGKIIIDSKETMEDRVNFKGRFLTDLLYISKGDKGIYSISGESPVNDFIEVKGANNGMYSNLDITISNIDYNILNDRKVNVSAMADITAKVTDQTELEAVSEITDLSKAQQKFSVISANSIVTEKRDKFNINEEINLPLSKPPIEDVLSVEGNIINPEFITNNDSVSVKGDIPITMLYTSGEGSLPEIYEFDLPFDGNIDAEGVRENMDINGSFFIENIYYNIDENEDGENRIIEIDVTVGTEFTASQNTEDRILEDAYSINNEINMDIVQICCDYVVCKNKSQYPVKEELTLDENAPDMLQIFKTGGTPYIDDIKITDNKVTIEGIINTDIMYITGNDESPVYNYKGVVPFTQTIEARGAKEGMEANVKANIAHIGFNMLSDREVEVRCALNTNTVVTKQICYDIPISAELNPMDEETIAKLPGMVIYVVKPGDTLWKLAKRFNSTIEDIAEINNIENPDLIYPGQRFIILKKIS